PNLSGIDPPKSSLIPNLCLNYLEANPLLSWFYTLFFVYWRPITIIILIKPFQNGQEKTA
ncbi:hypothetical protein, partial [Vibrio cholerae]|uniref:hypothetical protein n=1 Tax=Vibrio cholerae TaxID=666 RepID=UPI001BCFBD73